MGLVGRFTNDRQTNWAFCDKSTTFNTEVDPMLWTNLKMEPSLNCHRVAAEEN